MQAVGGVTCGDARSMTRAATADEVAGAAASWIEQHRSQPFFAWLHLFDPHSPYAPPPPFAAAHPGAPYDGDPRVGHVISDGTQSRWVATIRRIDCYSAHADQGELLDWIARRRPIASAHAFE